MDGFDAALARYRAFLAHDPITPLLRRSLALLDDRLLRDIGLAHEEARTETTSAALGSPGTLDTLTGNLPGAREEALEIAGVRSDISGMRSRRFPGVALRDNIGGFNG